MSGGGDGLVKVWDSQTGLLYATLTGHKEEVVSLLCLHVHVQRTLVGGRGNTNVIHNQNSLSCDHNSLLIT